MNNESIIFTTFLLAVVGYIGLTAVVLMSLKGIIPILFWRAVVLIILLHVIMVWTYHYEWQFSTAVRNEYTGFIIFHSALLMILISAITKKNISLYLVRISSLAVTVGALGAVFRYEAVELYRLPIIICAGLINAALLKILYGKRNLMKKLFD